MIKKKWKHGRIVNRSELKGRVYVGRRSYIWDTEVMQEIKEFVESKPIPLEVFVIDASDPELKELKKKGAIKDPMLALKRTTRNWLKKEQPDYMAVSVGDQLRVMRVDSPI